MTDPVKQSIVIVADRPETVIETKYWIGNTSSRTTVKIFNDKPFQLPNDRANQMLIYKGQTAKAFSSWISTFRNGLWKQTIEAVFSDGNYITFEIESPREPETI
jgi:hypothetical protein